jgi:hypothetical protein
MDAFGDFLGQRAIDHPVLLDPRLRLKGGGRDPDPKVAFAAGPGAGMAGMVMGFIDDFEAGWREGRPQLLFDAAPDGPKFCDFLIHDVVAKIDASDYN